MKQIVYADGFFDDLLQVSSEKAEAQIFHDIELLPSVPVLGSVDAPTSTRRIHGERVRKIPANPFDVIYRIRNDGDFLILGIMHQRAAR